MTAEDFSIRRNSTMRCIPIVGWRAMLLAGALAGAPVAASALAPEYGVFVRVLDAPAGSWSQVVSAMPGVFGRAGWTAIASYDPGTGGCRFQARVFVVDDPAYAAAIAKAGTDAAFALPLRVAVFEDENGTHVSLANPQSLSRTIVAETGYETAANEVLTRLQRALEGVPGTIQATEYGQMRDQGLIGKTMGVVAGGPFDSKVETIGSIEAGAATDVPQVAAAFAAAARSPTKRWGLRALYTWQVPGTDVVIVGLAGDKMEAKSFQIVGEGGDAERKGFACPGLSHAAAYPVEVVVAREGNEVKLLLIDEMFRMKMYFEDAGTMKFAANMAMPGSIEDEIRDLAEDALDSLAGRAAVR
jgi:hypothetical protein